MIKTDCYLAILDRYRAQFPNAHFEIITRSAGHILSPSKNLLEDYKQAKISWEQYVVRFIEEMFASPKAMEKIKELRQLSLRKLVYLVCYEKDASQCHRAIIAKLVKHEYMMFDEEYPKLICKGFTTIRDCTHGLISDINCYILVQGKYRGIAKIENITHRSLEELPVEFLKRDANVQNYQDGISKLQRYYPDCDLFAIFTMKWIQCMYNGGIPA